MCVLSLALAISYLIGIHFIGSTTSPLVSGLGYGGRVFGMFLRRHCEVPAGFLGKEVRNDENGTRTAQMDDDSALDVSMSAVFRALFHRDTT